jgi:hypothetical protein
MYRIRNEVQSLKGKTKLGYCGLLPGALRWTVAGLQREKPQGINIPVITAEICLLCCNHVK